MFSDIYGFEGSKELRTLAKKMRLDRAHLRQEGHPVDEHYLIPSAKHAGMAARGVEIVSSKELLNRQDAKRLQVSVAISTAKVRPMVPYVPDEAWQPPSFDNRRRDRRKDWRQGEEA